jgi:hypothetical protein
MTPDKVTQIGVYYPCVEGYLVYDAEIGDGFTGLFQSQHQREQHLNEAKKAIAREIVKGSEGIS